MCTLCGPEETADHSRGAGIGRRSMLAGAAATPALMTLGAASASAKPRKEPAHLELVLLGTKAGPPIDPLRTGIASALVVDGATYVIDCGRSAATQYLRAGLTFKSLKGIFVTHLHADHVADYYNFFLLAGSVPNQEGDSLPGPVPVYGPGPAGGLPPTFGGGTSPTINPAAPTPGIAQLTDDCHDAYAYSTNVFLRDMGIRDIRTLADVHEIAVPASVGATFQHTAPPMPPFVVMQDENVRVSAILVPHGPVFPAFAFRFDTKYGSVTFSGDTTYTPNIPRLAHGTDVLVHEAINVRGWSNGTPVFVDHLLQSHVEVQEVGPIAQASRAKHLVLSHISDLRGNPLPAAQWRKWARAGYDGPVTIGEDLQRIRIV
ncbi:MBL fold metallo-hydrolase [Flexivirga sp.]|uniref:MBL fold metallo-hydrolase n=1 Tax=Flexivirga sp. TaxID=1962927 RepID=UPI003F7F9249